MSPGDGTRSACVPPQQAGPRHPPAPSPTHKQYKSTGCYLSIGRTASRRPRAPESLPCGTTCAHHPGEPMISVARNVARVETFVPPDRIGRSGAQGRGRRASGPPGAGSGISHVISRIGLRANPIRRRGAGRLAHSAKPAQNHAYKGSARILCLVTVPCYDHECRHHPGSRRSRFAASATATWRCRVARSERGGRGLKRHRAAGPAAELAPRASPVIRSRA